MLQVLAGTQAGGERVMAKEIRIDGLVVHPWERQRNGSDAFSCDYWDCPNKIERGDTFYLNLYPDGNAHTYCLECSAFFMSQAVNAFMSGGQNLPNATCMREVV